ncbi:hypothetical protein N752_07005 [Desulforamulus aquiferis]|nr:hypothetical protein N752_07005 [Desulforamulus aquiferis]
MLFAMGAQLGANDKLVSDLSRLGWQAMVLAFGSILGSLMLVRLAENYINKQLEGNRNKTTQNL